MSSLSQPQNKFEFDRKNLMEYISAKNKSNDENRQIFSNKYGYISSLTIEPFIKHNLVDQSTQPTPNVKSKKKALIPKNTPLSKKVRSDTWNEYIGAHIGQIMCPCCNKNLLTQGECNGWDVAHVVPKCKRGDNTIPNLRVVCKGCNSSMATKYMKDFCEHYDGLRERLKLVPS
jgi:hypothetical protein